MSALGHKRTFRYVRPMSALLPKADIAQHDRDVHYVPNASGRDARGSARPSKGPRAWDRNG
jgi:hypothetical protein